MKKILITAAFVITAALCKAQHNCDLSITINKKFSKAATLDSLMKVYTTNMLPGIAMAVYAENEGWWAGAQGYADVKHKILMNNCHLQYLQSVSKMYMAVEILQLKEQGKINPDAAITTYLPAKYSSYIKNAQQITVRMLLNHTSGVPEYNDNPTFVSQVMLHPLDYFTADDCLKSTANEPQQFAPGSKYLYTNTNYLLLSLIGDAITGDHAAFIKKNIFEPMGLVNTYYAGNHDYLNGLYLPESYWDVFNNEKPVNITPFQAETVASSKGDDGIICTPADAVKFFKGLMEGKLLKPESMKEMFDFVKDEKGNKRYGMGMIYFDLEGLPSYGHGGGGVGAGCGLMYIPSHKIYVFFSTNLGVLVDSKLSQKAGEFKNAALVTLLK